MPNMQSKTAVRQPLSSLGKTIPLLRPRGVDVANPALDVEVLRLEGSHS
jgi:hypothetical protein